MVEVTSIEQWPYEFKALTTCRGKKELITTNIKER